MNKQYQRVLVTTPHPLLRLVCLGLVTFIFTLFSLELTRFGTLLAPLWFPTSIMMVAFYRHAGKCGPALPSPALLAISLPRGCSSHGNRSTSPTRRSISLRPRLARCYCVNCSPGIIRCKTSTTGSGLPSAVPLCRRWWGRSGSFSGAERGAAA